MVLESVVICVDNSDFMRNEDFMPNRLKAQVEALTVVVYAKCRASPENYLSLVTLADNRVLTHLTNSEAKLLNDLSQVQMGGSIRLLQALNVAQLVLKHRPIKHAKCRIVAFVGSPVEASENDIVNMGKKFKKENIMVDIVNFGGEKGAEVLKKLIDTLNGAGGTSNSFAVVPPNSVLADFVVSSGLAAANRDFGGVHEDEDDEELRRAIEWSMREAGGPPVPQSAAQPTGIQDGNSLSDDEQLRLAIQLSLQEAERIGAIPEQPQTTNTTRTTSPENINQRNSASSKTPSAAPNKTVNFTDQVSSPASTASSERDNPPSSNTNNNKNSTSSNNTNTSNNSNTNNNGNSNNNDTNNNNSTNNNTSDSTNTNKNNSNNSNATANSDTSKTTADNKEVKTTILTKKR